MTTIDKMKQLLRPPDEFLNNLTDQPTVELINEKIITSLIIGIKADVGALQFCDVLEDLVNGESSTTDIEAVRNGME